MTARASASRRPASAPLPWIDKWLAACHDLAELERSNPMTDAVIQEIDLRMIRVGDKWLADFASCNYLGFDLERDIIDVVPSYLEKWGTHPSWSRLLGSPVLYEQIEERLAELVGAPDTLVLPTITLIHMSVIPVLAGSGTIYVESRAHKTIYEGCQLAAARGATIKRFIFEDAEDLERLLREGGPQPRLICVDGVNSMTGNAIDLPAFANLAREYDALLYVDDAHGFGVIGERSDDELSVYGNRGNSIVRYTGETYDHVLLVAGLSKAYSSLAAFLTCPPDLKRLLKTAKVLGYLDRIGVHTPNRSGFPIIEVPLARQEDIDAVGRFLFDNGIYVTLAAYPLVPKSEVGFRIQMTDANTDGEVDQLIDVLGRLVNVFDLQPARPKERAA